MALPYLTQLFERALQTGAVQLPAEAKVGGAAGGAGRACSGLPCMAGAAPPAPLLNSTHNPPRLPAHPATAQLSLMPRIGRALAQGGRQALREREAVALLRAGVDPETLLNTQQLAQFLRALQARARWAARGGRPFSASTSAAWPEAAVPRRRLPDRRAAPSRLPTAERAGGLPGPVALRLGRAALQL